MPTNELATWSDLPTEIVEQVLAYLGPPSLLSMGKLNRFLNRLALEKFFGSSIDCIQTNKLVPPFPLPEGLMLSGLCIALWLDNITELDQRIIGDLHQSSWQFRKLTAFVERLHHLKSLTLRICILLPFLGWRGYREEGDLLVGQLHRLVEIALNKGCEKLRIEGSSIPHCRLSSSDIRTLRVRTLRSNCVSSVRAWKWLKRHIFNASAQETARSSPSRPREMICSALHHDDPQVPYITECVLRSPALLGTTALPYMVNLLRRNAETITHLDINIYGLTRSNYKARALSIALFDNIHLPCLKTFILTLQLSTISTKSFAWFLSRHRNISVLKINDPSTLPQQSNLIRVKHCQPHFPALKTLEVPSRIIEWLFSSEIELPHTLESVTLRASHGPDNLESLGNAIRELRQGMRHIQTLTLETNWWSYDSGLWDHRYDRLGRMGNICRLQVRKVVLLVGERPSNTTIGLVWLACYFASVVKFFSAVTELEIIPRVYQEYQVNESFKKAIKDWCPSLKVVQC